MDSRLGQENEQYEIVMFYNVENFFAPDVKSRNRFDKPASGLRKWDERKFRNKLIKTAQVFGLAKEDYAVLPMLIGLAEIQGEKVLKDLVEMEVFEGAYGFIHYESMDERGVDVALLYDKRKIKILDSQSFSYFFEITDQDPENYDTTRDVLWVKAEYEGQLMNILVLHLPSKREHDVNKPKRDYIMNDVRQKIMDMVGKHESVLLMGDFNENPDDENLNNVLLNDHFEAVLKNPFDLIYKNNVYSTFHQGSGLLFDQIVLSNDFYKENAVLRFSEAAVFAHHKISNWDRKFLGRPFRTYAGTRYLGGYSDHFPVIIKFRKN